MERRVLPPRLKPFLSPEPTEEELARDWTLSVDDEVEVLKCRGEGNRRRFAVQLCALRLCGCFIDDYTVVPVEIANHVGRQAGLAPSLFIEAPAREATEREHRQRIRAHLGIRPFDRALERTLRVELAARVGEDRDLLEVAEELLRSWNVELPGPSTLERLVASVSARVKEQVFERIAARVPEEMRRGIDALLEVEDGDHQSSLACLKRDPVGATPEDILQQIERYRLLLAMRAHELDFSDIPAHLLRDFADLVRRYHAWRLRRFGDEKRYAMVACFLAEAVKSSLDYVIE